MKDTERVKRFVRLSTMQVKMNGGVSASLVLEMIDYIRRLEAFADDCQRNWDCDSDAHKYGTTCRACAASEAMVER